MTLKKTSVQVTPEIEEAVLDKAWRDYRVRSWQGAMDLAIKRFLDDGSVVPVSANPRIARIAEILGRPGNMETFRKILLTIANEDPNM